MYSVPRTPIADPHTVARVFDEAAPTYDDHFRRGLDLAEDDVVLEWLVDVLAAEAPLRVADLGCGTGWFMRHFPEDLVEWYLGTDISEGMLAVAREHFSKPTTSVSLLHSDMTEYLADTVNGMYDAIVSTFGSVSYVEPWNLDTLLKHSARVLRPGGKLAFVTFGPRYAKRKHHIVPDTILFYPTPAWLWRGLLARAGFVNVTIEGLNASGEAVRWLRSRRLLAGYLKAEMRLFSDPDRYLFHLISAETPPYA